MTNTSKHAQCKAMVNGSGPYGYFNQYQCSRKAVIGEHCKIHDPASRKAKQDASYQKYKVELEETRKLCTLEKAAPDLLEALEHILEYFPSMFSSEGSMSVSGKKVRAAIAKAKGE
jgi:hypothetical protein